MAVRRNVVILGASGFIGKALHAAFAASGDAEVIGHSSQTVDLTRPETLGALDGCVGAHTTLVVAAGLTPDRGQNPRTLRDSVTMVSNLAGYLESRPPASCVYLGSDAVYGFDGQPVHEASPLELGGYYALGKYAGERILEFALAPRKVPFLVLRLTGVYGPGDPHASYGPNLFARTLANGRTVRLFGEGEEERDHVYVEDVARLLVRLVDAPAAGILNVATGESRRFSDIVKTIRGLVPYDFEVVNAPRRVAVTHRRFDIARLRAVVPDFEFTDFTQGLRATLGFFGALLGSSSTNKR